MALSLDPFKKVGTLIRLNRLEFLSPRNLFAGFKINDQKIYTYALNKIKKQISRNTKISVYQSFIPTDSNIG